MADHRVDPAILRANDMRGIYGQNLWPADAEMLGLALAGKVRASGGSRIAVGRDGRLSSPELEQALVAGLTAGGAEVLRLGVGPTPMVSFAVHRYDLDGGAMVTGSHNSPEINGIKVLLGKAPLGGALLADMMNQRPKLAPKGEGHVRDFHVLTSYIESLRNLFRGNRPLSVAWDPGHGATAEIVCRLAASLPGRHFVINDTIDGRFPDHGPDPTVAENLRHLCDIVRRNGCEIGLAFDGDGDRIGVVDAEGEIVYADQLLALFSEEVLRARPGASIVADVKSSESLLQHIRALGGKPVLCASGRGFVHACMQQSEAPLGGELSGHLFFADRSYGFDDGLYAAIRLLSTLAGAQACLKQRVAALPKSVATPEIRVPCRPPQVRALLHEVERMLPPSSGNVIQIDGLRVTSEEGWWLLRCSNTEDALVIRCEARTSEGLERLKSEVRRHLARHNLDSALA